MAASKWKTLDMENRLDEVKQMASQGLIDKDIAKNLGISKRLFEDWKKKYSALSAYLKKGKEPADKKVESALYKIANGYEYTEIHEHIRQDGDKQIKEVKRIKKFYSPNVVAQIFWLKNRLPDKWRDRREDLIALVSKDDLKKSSDDIEKILAGLNEKK